MFAEPLVFGYFLIFIPGKCNDTMEIMIRVYSEVRILVRPSPLHIYAYIHIYEILIWTCSSYLSSYNWSMKCSGSKTTIPFAYSWPGQVYLTWKCFPTYSDDHFNTCTRHCSQNFLLFHSFNRRHIPDL